MAHLARYIYCCTCKHVCTATDICSGTIRVDYVSMFTLYIVYRTHCTLYNARCAMHANECSFISYAYTGQAYLSGRNTPTATVLVR